MKLNPKEVDRIVSNYEQGKNLDLPILMSDARVLVCQSYRYADYLGELGKTYRSVRVNRKRLFAELKAKYRGEGESVAGAELKAESAPEYQGLQIKEAELEGSYTKGKDLLGAIQKVLDRMNQEISDLKKERDYQRHLEVVA